MTRPRLTAPLAGALIAAIALPGAAFAACDEVRFSDVGWTDITATTAVAKTVLTALGYDVDVKVTSTCSWATGCRRWRRTFAPISTPKPSTPWGPT
jgi:ABC-type proline/glycine betaine transport system substrate-binding protein